MSTNQNDVIEDLERNCVLPSIKWYVYTAGIRRSTRCIKSSLMKIKTVDGSEFAWKLCFYPRGIAENKCVQLVSLNTEKVSVKAHLVVRPRIGFTFTNKSEVLCKDFPCLMGSSSDVYFDRNLFLNETTGQLKDGTFWIDCYFYYISCDGVRVKQGAEVSHEVHEFQDNDVLLKLVRDKSFGDVEVQVDGEIFRAHQALLSNQSKIFAEMLRTSGDEQNKCIVIDDVEARVFEEILRFVYCNKVHGVEKYTEGLFAAATRYSMEALRNICEKTVIENLTCENAIQYLRSASSIELQGLRKQIIEFMALNLSKMIKSPSFISLKEVQSDLLFEIIRATGEKLSSANSNNIM